MLRQIGHVTACRRRLHAVSQDWSQAHAKALLRAAKADGPRSNALINVLLFTGVRISEALGANGTIDPSRILVHVEFGIVILSGIVDSEEERSLAMQLATSVAGVRHVENDLELSEEQRLWNIAQLN